MPHWALTSNKLVDVESPAGHVGDAARKRAVTIRVPAGNHRPCIWGHWRVRCRRIRRRLHGKEPCRKPELRSSH